MLILDTKTYYIPGIFKPDSIPPVTEFIFSFDADCASAMPLLTAEIIKSSINSLSSFKISDYKIYRIFPNSEVQYLHPKDGVFPEKLNEGRVGVGNIGHSIGKNPNPVNVKFSGKNTFDG